MKTAALCDKAVFLGCKKLFLPSSCLSSGSCGRLLLLAKADRMDTFYYSGVIADELEGRKISAKCGEAIN